jgi:GT2 family glycosyltransferase
MLIKAKIFKDIGLLDEGYMYSFEEVDFEKRTKDKAWKIWYVPEAVVYHKWIGAKYLGVKRTLFLYKGLLRYSGKHINFASPCFLFLFILLCVCLSFIMKVLKWIKRRVT